MTFLFLSVVVGKESLNVAGEIGLAQKRAGAYLKVLPCASFGVLPSKRKGKKGEIFPSKQIRATALPHSHETILPSHLIV
jgi:hypothetical protein